jgi:hypothetical protein
VRQAEKQAIAASKKAAKEQAKAAKKAAKASGGIKNVTPVDDEVVDIMPAKGAAAAWDDDVDEGSTPIIPSSGVAAVAAAAGVGEKGVTTISVGGTVGNDDVVRKRLPNSCRSTALRSLRPRHEC